MLSENFKKNQKNREHLELIWSSYRWDVPTFWTLSALAYSLFHAILKNKKKKMVKNGRLMVYHFWNKFPIYSAQKARHLKNHSFERIYVQNWILEVEVPILGLSSVTLLEQIYDLLCSKKCTFEKCTFWRNLRSKLWFNEVGTAGRPAVPKLFLYSMSGAYTERSSRFARAIKEWK